MVYIKFGIVFELFVYKIYGDSDGAFLCGTEILNSRLNEMDFTCHISIRVSFNMENDKPTTTKIYYIFQERKSHFKKEFPFLLNRKWKFKCKF